MQNTDQIRKNLLTSKILSSKINYKYIEFIDNDKNMLFKKNLAKAVLKIELYFRPRIIIFLELILVFFNIIFYIIGIQKLKNYTVGYFQIGIKTSLKWTKKNLSFFNYIKTFFLLNNFKYAYRIFIIGLNTFIKDQKKFDASFINKFAVFYNGNSNSTFLLKYSEMLKTILEDKISHSDIKEIQDFISKIQKYRKIIEEKSNYMKQKIDKVTNLRFNKIKLLINKPDIFCATLIIVSKQRNKILYSKAYGNYGKAIPILETRRLVGSTLKIALYSAYIETFNAQLNEKFIDKSIEITNNNQKIIPRNADNKFRGEVSLEYAFANSINSVAIQVLMKLGIDNFINYLRLCGITIPLPKSPLLALGAIKLTWQEILAFFSPVIYDGFLNWIFTNDIDKKNIPLNNKKQIISKSTVIKMQHLLQATTLYGTAKFLNKYNNSYKIYGKTGTSEGNRDMLFVGTINKDLYGLVWLGSNNEEKLLSTDIYPISAARIAVPVWHDILNIYSKSFFNLLRI